MVLWSNVAIIDGVMSFIIEIRCPFSDVLLMSNESYHLCPERLYLGEGLEGRSGQRVVPLSSGL
jgi:hypothetical protein